MTRALVAEANCIAKLDTPPVPCTTTISPACRVWWPATAIHAVRPAVGSVAACS
jgi:hypothetical protein